MPITEQHKLKLQQETLSLLKKGNIEKVILDIKRCDSSIKTCGHAIHLMDAYIEGMLTLVRHGDLECIKQCIQAYPWAKISKLPKDTPYPLWATPLEIIVHHLPIEIYSDSTCRTSFESMMVNIVRYVMQEKSYQWMLSETCATRKCLFQRLTENAVVRGNLGFFVFMTNQVTFSLPDLRAAADEFERKRSTCKALARSQSEKDCIDKIQPILQHISRPVNTFEELAWFLQPDNEAWLHYLRIGSRTRLVSTTVHHVMGILPNMPLDDTHPFASLIRHGITASEINQCLLRVQQPPGFFGPRYTDEQVAIAARLQVALEKKHPNSGVAPVSSWALLSRCFNPSQVSPVTRGEENNPLIDNDSRDNDSSPQMNKSKIS